MYTKITHTFQCVQHCFAFSFFFTYLFPHITWTVMYHKMCRMSPFQIQALDCCCKLRNIQTGRQTIIHQGPKRGWFNYGLSTCSPGRTDRVRSLHLSFGDLDFIFCHHRRISSLTVLLHLSPWLKILKMNQYLWTTVWNPNTFAFLQEGQKHVRSNVEVIARYWHFITWLHFAFNYFRSLFCLDWVCMRIKFF